MASIHLLNTVFTTSNDTITNLVFETDGNQLFDQWSLVVFVVSLMRDAFIVMMNFKFDEQFDDEARHQKVDTAAFIKGCSINLLLTCLSRLG